MAKTSRLNLQYPDENQNPFWNIIVSFFHGLDSHIFANMSDRNLILKGGGIISFNSSSGLVTWGSDFKLVDYVSGFIIKVLASNITLADGEAAYIDSSRVLSQSITASLEDPSASVGVGEGKIVFFVRNGSKIIFRNGVVLDSGVSGAVVENGGVDSRSGTEAFVAQAFKDVIFNTPFADTNYRVVGLVADTPSATSAALYTPSAQKTVSGFRIATTDASNLSGNVDWKVEHD